MARFRITKDNVLLLEVDLKQDMLSIGRGPETDIRLGDLTVSRTHARVVRLPGGRFAIEDAESTNGVYLNGHRLEHRTVLTHGDALAVGAYQLDFSDSEELATLRFEVSRLAGQSSTDDDRSPASSGNTGAGVLINEANNAMFTLASGKAVLGNEGEVDIRVPGHEGVRASITQQGAQFYICSETATPCVKVNGAPVMNALLAFNDRIEAGGRRFIFRQL